jgi:hypothetical protein
MWWAKRDWCHLREAQEFNDAFEAKAKQDLDGFHVRLKTLDNWTQVGPLAVCVLTVTSAPNFDIVDTLQMEYLEHFPPAGKRTYDSESRRFQYPSFFRDLTFGAHDERNT